MAKQSWWADGVKFECQGSGKCCVSRGSYGFVYLTPFDRKRMAAHLKLSTREFTKLYCAKTDGHVHLREDIVQPECVFLKGKGCSVYEARPTQCRTWPFWPENMTPRAWAKEVESFCPGVGKGKKVPVEEIRRQIAMQKEAEEV